MLERFLEFISEKSLWKEGDKVTLAVSGGIDSVVMLQLFHQAGIPCIIAHCNFNLRGAESDGDEHFVRSLAARLEIPVYVASFQTESYAEQEKVSIQMAARILRYDWFEELCEETGCQSVATAHNRDDSEETFFLNLMRGTGIRGLTGIQSRNGRVIRPLLFASRSMIQEYAGNNQLAWREDSSNLKTDYTRNRIRHMLIPVIREMNEKSAETMQSNIERLRYASAVYHNFLAEKKRNLLHRQGKFQTIQIGSITAEPFGESLLYEILSDFDFTAPQVREIFRGLHGSAGKQYFSLSFRLIRDRGTLILEPLKPLNRKRYYIDNPYNDITEPIHLRLSLIQIGYDFDIPAEPGIACVDFDKLDFPLIIRRWENGDYFRPLGMSGMKKLSDFFIDNKVPVPLKENSWLITSGKDIVWVAGMRIDDRFRIGPETKRALRMELVSPET